MAGAGNSACHRIVEALSRSPPEDGEGKANIDNLMGKQHNKVIKRGRRRLYQKRRKLRIKENPESARSGRKSGARKAAAAGEKKSAKKTAAKKTAAKKTATKKSAAKKTAASEAGDAPAGKASEAAPKASEEMADS